MTEQNLDLNGFRIFLKLRDTREITILRHLRCLKLVGINISSFTHDQIKTYLDNQKLSGTTNSTLNNVITTIRLYGYHLQLGPEITKYPLFVRRQSIVRQTFSDDQIEAFLSAPLRYYQVAESYKMFQVFWAIIAFTAMRPGECVKLKKSDIDLANKQILLRPEITKTNQFSTLPLFPNILPIVEEYIKDLKTEYLFPSQRQGKSSHQTGEALISQQSWGVDFEARLKQIGVTKTPGLVPYSLRHSCATRWISNDMNFYKVRRLMRHVKIEQTLVYEHMTSGHLVESVLKYDPLVRKHSDPLTVLESLKEAINNFGLEKDLRFSEEFKKELLDSFFKESQRLRLSSS